jgi:ZIP family zinc transporter
MRFFQLAHPLLQALVATLIAGFGATTLGALPVLVVRSLSEKVNNLLLSFAAGVMLAATIFSLLLPAIAQAEKQGLSTVWAVSLVILALCAGGGVLSLIHRLVPHAHFSKGAEGGHGARLKRIWLFVWAITLHNFPEGLSVGVAAASGDAATGLSAIIGIGLQNLPEGLSVAVALLGQGYTRGYALRIAAFTGLVEIAGGLAGAGVLALSAQLLPCALAFAAGAMLWVISDEIIPETHRPGLEGGATAALFGGFGIMMFLDAVFAA